MTPTRPTRTRGRSTPARSAALSRCVEPLAADEFLDEYFERRPLVAAREGGARFDDLLSEADVERLVCGGGLRHPAFRLVKANEKIPLADYTTDVPWRPAPFAETAEPGKIAALFADGATIVVQGLHHWWEPVARFCRALEAELGHPAQTNAYYTPRGSQGLPVHHDTHDVFVLQVSGEKRWRVYDPVLELPLRDQRYSEDMGGPGDAVHDVVLRAGDTLYLPRGWLHEAVTSDTDSLHLTIGVNLYTWTDALRAALAEAEADVELRRSVPEDGSGAEAALEALSARLDGDAVARRMRRRFVRTRRPILADALSQLRALERLDTSTRVERRETVLFEVVEAPGRIGLLFEGRRVDFPDAVSAQVEYVAGAEGTFTAADLPGDLDAAGRLVLVHRLVREGYLRISDAGRGAPSRGNGGAARE